jgi:hypothetical protein
LHHADGIVFAISDIGRLSDGKVGGFGFVNNNSLGIRFDTYSNIYEPASDFSQIILNGYGYDTFSPHHTHANLENGAWHTVSTNWDASSQTLSYSLDGTFVGSKQYDVTTNLLGGATVGSFGFQGMNGHPYDYQKVQVLPSEADHFSVDVGSGAGTLVATLGSDSTAGSVSYQIVDDEGDAVTDALFEIVSGQLKVESGVTISNSGGDTHDNYVKATDASGSFVIEQLDIGIRRVGVRLVASVDGPELQATADADLFVFGPGFGEIEVTDFEASGSSLDIVRFNHTVFDDWTDIVAAATQVGDDVEIVASINDTIT